MLYFNALVIIIALDHIEYDVGSRIGCGGERFLKNRSVNATAVVLARDHSVFQRAARGNACVNKCLSLAVVDQILNRGGRGHNGTCFFDDIVTCLNRFRFIVIALGYVNHHGICTCVYRRAVHKVALIVVILDGDSAHTDDTVLDCNGNRLSFAVISEVGRKCVIEMNFNRRCLFDGEGLFYTARVVALAADRDRILACVACFCAIVNGNCVIHTDLKRNAAHGNDHGGSLCRAVVFGIRYGDHRVSRKVCALLDGDVGQLGSISGSNDLAVGIVEVVIFRNGVCPSHV